jgi:ABC-2 type transport system permease protein
VKGFLLLLRWQYLRQRQVAVLVAAVQVFIAVGVVYGLSYLEPHIDAASATYLATGAPTLTLLVLGLNVVPSEVAQSRLTGHYEYVAALPVSRLAPPLAAVTFWLAAALPGMLVSLAVAVARFDLHLHVGIIVVPVILLVAVTSAAVGYAMAAAMRPETVQRLGSFLSVVLLLFCPIDFPASRLPGWLQAVQDMLPVQYMGDLMRWSLTGRYTSHPALAFAVIGAWGAGALAIIGKVAVNRR